MYGSKWRNGKCNVFIVSCFKKTDLEAIIPIEQKTLSIVSTVIVSYETTRNYVLRYAICNLYREQSRLFINKQTLFSQEGTTQGDSITISIYGIAIIPLSDLLDDCFTDIKWYADNGNAVGSIDNFKKFFDSLKKRCPGLVTILPNATSLPKYIFLKERSRFLLTTKWK